MRRSIKQIVLGLIVLVVGATYVDRTRGQELP